MISSNCAGATFVTIMTEWGSCRLNGWRSWLVAGCTTILLLLVSELPAHAESAVDYLRQVKPLLAEKCFACHGALKQEGGLRLDTAELAREGGFSGAAAVPGDSEASEIIARVTSTDDDLRMPLEAVRRTKHSLTRCS